MTKKPDIRAILGLIFGGLYLTHLGRRRWKIYQRLKETPTTKINTITPGRPGEIKGKVFSFPEDMVVSPLTQTRGAAFIWQIEEWKVGVSGKYIWEVVIKYYSIPYLYFTDNSEGLAGIDLEHAEFFSDLYSTTIDDINAEATEFIQKNKLIRISDGKFRIKEKVFQPDEEFFIHGLSSHAPIAYLHTESGNVRVGRRASFNQADPFTEKSYLEKCKVFFKGRAYLTTKSENDTKKWLLSTSVLFLAAGPALFFLGMYLLIKPYWN